MCAAGFLQNSSKLAAAAPPRLAGVMPEPGTSLGWQTSCSMTKAPETCCGFKGFFMVGLIGLEPTTSTMSMRKMGVF